MPDLAGNAAGSCSSVNGFLNEINAQDGKKLEHQIALQLIQQADALEAVIGCSA